MARGLRLVRTLLFAALLVHVALFAWVVARRIGFPYQTEWMTGSVLDHIERVRAGLPVYAEPTAGWIAYIYPPLYLWLGAALGGTAIACRLLSLAATLFQAGCVVRVSRDLGVPRFWSAAAGCLFFGCFSYGGWWYDIERCDSLFGAMMLGLVVVLFRARSTRAFAAAGVLGALGVLAKQQAVLYAAAAGVALLVASRGSTKDGDAARAPAFRDAIAFATSFALALTAMVFLLERASHGWFLYYFFRMPRAHGIAWSLAGEIAAHDLGGGSLLVAATLAAGAVAIRSRLAGTLSPRATIFVAMLLAGFAAAMSSRLHVGGWFNVLQPWTAFACIAVVWLAWQAEQAAATRGARARLAVAAGTTALVVWQLVAWRYDPREVTPRPGMLAATERLYEIVHRLETRGEVLFVGRGHVTRERHFQMSGLADVARVDGRSPPDLVRGLRERRFAAILDDARLAGDQAPPSWPAVMLEDVSDLRAPLFSRYYLGERIDEELIDIPMRSPAAPRWVYFPRKAPLDESLEALKARQLRELRLADERNLTLRKGGTPSYSAEDIELLAATGGP